MHKMLPYGMVLKLCLLTVGCLMSVLADTSSDSTRSEISSSSSSSGHRRFSYKHGEKDNIIVTIQHSKLST